MLCAAPLPVVLQAKTGTATTPYLYAIGTRPIAQYTSGNAEYLLPDALGSIRQIADAAGNVTLAESYEPRAAGSVLTSTGTASSIFGYAGEQLDNTTGLIYLRARYMNPRLGIFLAHVPWSGDMLRPGSMNGFNYVEGDPINRVDPSGRQSPVRPVDCLPPNHLESKVVWDAAQQKNVVIIECVDSNGHLYLPPGYIKSGTVFVGQDPTNLIKAILAILGITCVGVTTLEAVRSTDVDWPKPQQPGSTPTPIPPQEPDRSSSTERYALDTNALIALERWIWSINDRNGDRLDAKIKNIVTIHAIEDVT